MYQKDLNHKESNKSIAFENFNREGLDKAIGKWGSGKRCFIHVSHQERQLRDKQDIAPRSISKAL